MRWRRRAGKADLAAWWDKREGRGGDVVLFHSGNMDGRDGGRRADAHWLSGIFTKAVTDELAARGYDLDTLKFSIRRKDAPVPEASPARMDEAEAADLNERRGGGES